MSKHESSPELDQGSLELASVLRKYGHEHGFDPETCGEVEVLSFGEAFEMTYSYLNQAGLDPDVILADFIEEHLDQS